MVRKSLQRSRKLWISIRDTDNIVDSIFGVELFQASFPTRYNVVSPSKQLGLCLFRVVPASAPRREHFARIDKVAFTKVSVHGRQQSERVTKSRRKDGRPLNL